ncbi:hypothetical protein AGMMS49975_27950 [Clostridia bacterium]|nr:hypothetical protein AGMMS49975_27950 [Clostridia bacterium]
MRTGSQYLQFDFDQAETLDLNRNSDFDNHWMTVTKYFEDGNTGTKYVAISTWGKRVSDYLLQPARKEILVQPIIIPVFILMNLYVNR